MDSNRTSFCIFFKSVAQNGRHYEATFCCDVGKLGTYLIMKCEIKLSYLDVLELHPLRQEADIGQYPKLLIVYDPNI